MQTALQTERVLHLRGSLRYNVEVFSEPAQGLTPRICLLSFPLFSLVSFHTRIHNTTVAVLLGTLIPAVLTPMMRYSISQRCG